MKSVKRALLLSSADRYCGLIVNFISMATLSRLLAPAEIGIAAIGLSLLMLAIAIRDFAAPTYLVQRVLLTQGDIRTVATIYAAMNLLAAAVVTGAAPVLAASFAQPGLQAFLYVLAAALVAETASAPLAALLQRRLDYSRLALINIAAAATNMIVAVSLALLGFSFMSIAYASLAASLISASLMLAARPPEWSCRPSLAVWREVLRFCGYQGLSSMLVRAYEALPQQIIGHTAAVASSGLFNRTMMIAQLGTKVFLGTVDGLSLPALAAEQRAGRDLKTAYLKGLELITAVQWPLLILVALLAHPIVSVLLGAQWLQIVPMVQVITLAALAEVPACLSWAVLVTFGAMRDRLLSALIAMPLSIALFAGAAHFGLHAAVWSFVLIVPFQALVQLHFMHRHLPIPWGTYGRSLRASAMVAGCTALGPVTAIALNGWHADLSIPAGILGGLLGVLCWAGALRLTQHPLFDAIATTLEHTISGPRLHQIVSRVTASLKSRTQAATRHANPSTETRP